MSTNKVARKKLEKLYGKECRNNNINVPKRDENGNLHYYKDLTGKRFGRLIVEKYLYTNYRRKAVWKCKCDCGNYVEVPSENLVTKNTKSCGCLHIEATKKNIQKAIEKQTKYQTESEKIIYHTFSQMKRRCYKPKCKAYVNYGARGIRIYSEWLKEPKLFYKWSIENGWEKGLSIDRIDVNGNYEPNNCRWVDNLTQQNNKRNSKFLIYNGQRHTVPEWSRILNIPVGTIADRIKRDYPIEKILNNNYKKRI